MKYLRERRMAADAAVMLSVWQALLAWGTLASTFESSAWTFQGVFATGKGENSTMTEVIPPRQTEDPRRPAGEMRAAGSESSISEEFRTSSLTPPKLLKHIDRNPHNTPAEPLYNLALISWGPGYLFYVTNPPKWTSPNCLLTHYTRHFRSNISQNQPVSMRDAFSCHTVNIGSKMLRMASVPCPDFPMLNTMCHLMGDHIAVQPWEKWADYSLYVNVLHTHWSSSRSPVPTLHKFARKHFPVRIYNCDPTKDCLPFPKSNSTTIGFNFGTTRKLHITSTTTTTPQLPHMSSKNTTSKKVCPGNCLSRTIAGILWPLFFVTTLLVLFGLLPFVYCCAKKKAERNLTKRWFRSSSHNENTDFMVKVPPAWEMGYRPDPSSGERSRTDPGESGRSGTGPPPAKRRRRA